VIEFLMENNLCLLSSMYYNWPGAVRVPAPCQYAHKLVTLIGTSVKKQVSDKLLDKLFYL
jgi:aubergine